VRRRLLILAGTVLALAAASIGTALIVARPAAERAFFAKSPRSMLVIAHRGGSALRPENTLAAFENAAALGVDVLEMDVHATADGKIVVIHDATVDRTTNGTGAVAALSFESLRKLDAGYRWTADGGRTFPFRGKGVRVPALAEVFERFPGKRMNIEIKPAEPAFAGALCDLVRRSGRSDLVLVASVQQAALDAFRGACPAVATSMTPREGWVFYGFHLAHLTAALSPRAAALQMPYRFRGRLVVSDDLVAAAHARNVRLHAWTVNDEAIMRQLIANGVDGILTDRPDLLLWVLGR
jgi:glycerophosphoryl diester phosphodiesterase